MHREGLGEDGGSRSFSGREAEEGLEEEGGGHEEEEGAPDFGGEGAAVVDGVFDVAGVEAGEEFFDGGGLGARVLMGKELERGVDNIVNNVNFRGMNRLTIEIEPEQHRQIKTLATFAGMTIKEFVLAKTLDLPQKQDCDSGDTTARLMADPVNAKRLRQAVASPTPKHLVFESIEDVKHALGI